MIDRRYYKIFKTVLICALCSAFLWWGRGVIRRISLSGLAPFVRSCHWMQFQIRRLRASGGGSQAEDSLRWQLLEKERMIEELQTRLTVCSNLERENLELRSLMGLKHAPEWKAVTAEVVLRDPVYWNQQFTIGKGLADQVPVGAVVMVRGQVLGRVVQNTRHLSVVAMLYSPDCRLGVRIGDSSYVGVCHGLPRNPAGSKLVEVEYLPRDLQVPPDTVLYTSGLGGILPAGLPVARAVRGRNGEVVQKQDQSRGSLYAELLKDVNRFQFVVVLVPRR